LSSGGDIKFPLKIEVFGFFLRICRELQEFRSFCVQGRDPENSGHLFSFITIINVLFRMATCCQDAVWTRFTVSRNEGGSDNDLPLPATSPTFSSERKSLQ